MSDPTSVDALTTLLERTELETSPPAEKQLSPGPNPSECPQDTSQEKEEPHPFATEPGDHAETPFCAYEDIAPLLHRLAERLDVTPGSLRIYDPFFCEGRVSTHLSTLGFTTVYNRNEDFYAVQREGRVPEYDVLVTNPPFSGDHIEGIHTFAVNSQKPYFILIPQYVSRKAFYLEYFKTREVALPYAYLGPQLQPYAFTAPNREDVRRMRGSGAGGKEGEEGEEVGEEGTTPGVQGGEEDTAGGFKVAAGSFQCVWFFSLGLEHHKFVLASWRRGVREGTLTTSAAIATDVNDLPQLNAAPKLTPAERR